MTSDLRQQILRILRDSESPLGPSDIARTILGFDKPDSEEQQKEFEKKKVSVHYHLKQLGFSSKVKAQDGKYSYSEFSKTNEEHAEKILDFLSTGGRYTYDEIYDHLGVGEDHYEPLDDLIQEDRVFIIKEGIRDSEKIYYELSPFGLSERELCPICKEKIKDSNRVLTAIYKSANQNKNTKWRPVSIHIDCYQKSYGLFEIVWGGHEGQVFCNHCGLPLSHKMITQKPIAYHLLADHFNGFETETLNLISSIRALVSEMHEKPATQDQWLKRAEEVSTLYEEFEIEVPNWISEHISADLEKIGQRDRFHTTITNFIRNDIGFYDDIRDLSDLCECEIFFNQMAKYRPDVPEGYDINSRIKDIWLAAQKLKDRNESRINRMYETLLGPAGSVHSTISPYWALEAIPEEWGDPDIQNTKLYSPINTQVITYRDGENVYHPYCAEKLGKTLQKGGD